MTEQELVDGLISRNNEAIQTLVNTYQKNVIKTAYYFVANMEDAEDLSQEVFLEVLRSVNRYKKRSSLHTWVIRITINKSLDHLRREKRRNFIVRMENVLNITRSGRNERNYEAAITDTTNEDREKRKILDTAIGSLPENQKIAFILNKYDELPYMEIAGIMNVSLSSVESLIHRAKINLQKKLADHFSEYGKKIK
jgi:RNA polymerase sigma-70 factor, ECF subfamily